MQILTTEDARYIDQEVPKQLGVSLEIFNGKCRTWHCGCFVGTI